MSTTLKKYKKKTAWQVEYIFNFLQKLFYFFKIFQNRKDVPDFLIIGLPKSATWWLSSILNAHPDVFLGTNPNGKGEVRYFSIHFNKSLNFYFNIFKNKPGLVKFEKSPDYCFISDLRIRFIKRLIPDIKIILMFRNPIDRAFSHAKMDLLRSAGREFNEVPFEQFKKHYVNTAKIYNYEVIWNKWHKHFDEKHLLVLFQEEIISESERVLIKVNKFLNVDLKNITTQDLSPRNTTIDIDLPNKHLDLLRKLNRENENFYQSKIRNLTTSV